MKAYIVNRSKRVDKKATAETKDKKETISGESSASARAPTIHDTHTGTERRKKQKKRTLEKAHTQQSTVKMVERKHKIVQQEEAQMAMASVVI